MAELNTTQLRDALAWLTNDQPKAEQPGTNPFIWFWEAVQGDFNDERSTGQIVMDAAISMIPLVDQVCDVRDLIANCNKLRKDITDTWAWVALALTLIGLFPTLGSLVKGVLKIFFLFIRRSGGDAMVKSIDMAMTWVITFLRRQDVQKYLKQLRVDEVFKWLAVQIKAVRQQVNTAALLKAFDRGIAQLQQLAEKVSLIPAVASKARAALDEVRKIREVADGHLARAVKPVQDALDAVIMRLEREAIAKRHGIVGVSNVHFRGNMPEPAAVTLMRNAEPAPEWLSKGTEKKFPSAVYDDEKEMLEKRVKEGWPPLQQYNVESFHSLTGVEIKGPARLYRILSPSSRAMSDCWVSEDVYRQIQNAKNPRAAWRKHLAVWPDWNVNGQFVIYEVKPGETLKAWKGPAAIQKRKSLPDKYLEGGWEQIVFTIARNDGRNDALRYYELHGMQKGQPLRNISPEEYYALSDEEREAYVAIREAINHPNISGPFDTGWGYTDFEGAWESSRIGLPALPGQVTNISSGK